MCEFCQDLSNLFSKVTAASRPTQNVQFIKSFQSKSWDLRLLSYQLWKMTNQSNICHCKLTISLYVFCIFVTRKDRGTLLVPVSERVDGDGKPFKIPHLCLLNGLSWLFCIDVRSHIRWTFFPPVESKPRSNSRRSVPVTWTTRPTSQSGLGGLCDFDR